jgi:sterol desaturase/sphingolipid hydroxylase (fatty acid hydroxylase superfamily)
MIGIPIALFVANASEWLIHRYVLHGRGVRRGSFWSFHFHEHHKACKRWDFFDPDYERSPFGWHAQGKELAGIVGLSLAVTPLWNVAPWFVLTSYYAGFNYYRLHKRAHLEPAWARRALPWHYDHHMGPNQHANWCDTRPWFDVIMGTREPYARTQRERLDRARRARRRRARAPAAQRPQGIG